MKRNIFSFTILIVTYVLPIFLLKKLEDDFRNIDVIQYTTFGVFFFGSILLSWLNWKKQENTKWVWLVFNILGILGFVYSGVVLYLLFSFRNGIGF
jgi:hypothetical protein